MLIVNVDDQCRWSMLKLTMVNVEARNVYADGPCQQSMLIVNVEVRNVMPIGHANNQCR